MLEAMTVTTASSAVGVCGTLVFPLFAIALSLTAAVGLVSPRRLVQISALLVVAGLLFWTAVTYAQPPIWPTDVSCPSWTGEGGGSDRYCGEKDLIFARESSPGNWTFLTMWSGLLIENFRSAIVTDLRRADPDGELQFMRLRFLKPVCEVRLVQANYLSDLGQGDPACDSGRPCNEAWLNAERAGPGEEPPAAGWFEVGGSMFALESRQQGPVFYTHGGGIEGDVWDEYVTTVTLPRTTPVVWVSGSTWSGLPPNSRVWLDLVAVIGTRYGAACPR